MSIIGSEGIQRASTSRGLIAAGGVGRRGESVRVTCTKGKLKREDGCVATLLGVVDKRVCWLEMFDCVTNIISLRSSLLIICAIDIASVSDLHSLYNYARPGTDTLVFSSCVI